MPSKNADIVVKLSDSRWPAKFRDWLKEQEQNPKFQAAVAEMTAEDAIISAAFDDDLGDIVQPDERMQWLGIYALGYAAGVDHARATAEAAFAKAKAGLDDETD